MKIVFFETEKWERKALKDLLSKKHSLQFVREPLSEKTVSLANEADSVSVFVYSKVDSKIIDKIPTLKLITTRSMGFDHIDLSYAKKKNIKVCNVPSYGERTVAEHTFALILAVSRKVFAAYERTERMNFDYHGLTGFDLYGKTIGIIGGGKIGMNVAKIAKNGFEMSVLVCDPFQKPELAKELGFKYSSIEDLLANSDVISLHAPYMESTHHIINEKNISLIKKGAILINTARGGLVDTKALLAALQKGILSGAGLDVLEEETFIKEEAEMMGMAFPEKNDLATIIRGHMLIARNDVVITPHIGFNSKEALQKIMSVTAENIDAFVSKSFQNVVNS